MVLLHVASLPVRLLPMRVNHHSLARLRLTLLVLRVVGDGSRVGTRHGLATVQAAIIPCRHHDSVDAVELYLVLLVQRVEVQPDLAVVAGLVHVEAVICCVDSVHIGLT